MPTIEIDGLRVAYEDDGSGLAIVFIPGLVGTKEWFRYQASGLRQSYRIISYEVRPARKPASYTLDLLAQDLAAFLEALKLQSAVIAGQSFGGMIAQRFAVKYPHMVDGLVLISAFPCLPEEPEETLLEWLSPGKVKVESPLAGLIRRILRNRDAAPSDDLEGLDWLAATSARIGRRTLKARLGLIETFDSREWLPGIEAPVLTIVGAKDQTPFLSGAQLIYEGIMGSSLEVVEEGDHFCFFTRHDIINALIDDFLSERIAG